MITTNDTTGAATRERIPGTHLPLRRGPDNHRYKPVGSICVKGPSGNRRKPVVYVKVCDTGCSETRWRLLGRVVWEQAHGPLPAGSVLWFRDRDTLNCELANLEAITMAERLRRNVRDNAEASRAAYAKQGRKNLAACWRDGVAAVRLNAARRKAAAQGRSRLLPLLPKTSETA